VGFEPTVEFPLHTLSKRAPSTTRTSLRVFRVSRLRAHDSAETRIVIDLLFFRDHLPAGEAGARARLGCGISPGRSCPGRRSSELHQYKGSPRFREPNVVIAGPCAGKLDEASIRFWRKCRLRLTSRSMSRYKSRVPRSTLVRLRHDLRWEKARDLLLEAAKMHEGADVLEGLGWAYYWLDDAEHLFDVRERAYRAYLESPRRGTRGDEARVRLCGVSGRSRRRKRSAAASQGVARRARILAGACMAHRGHRARGSARGQGPARAIAASN
jgi:hypothetical protein